MILERLYSVLNIKNDAEFCDKYGVKQNTVSGWKRRESVPYELIEKIAQNEHISLDTILFGKKITQNTQPDNNSTTIALPRLSMTASAGMGNSLEGIEVFNTGEIIHIDKAIFKTPPKNNLGIIQVDGYSMVPMLLPDSWVIYEETKTYTTDGMYILNWRNNLMVKLLQLNLSTGALDIISVNKDYQSYTTSPDDQSSFYIIGKVIKVII